MPRPRRATGLRRSNLTASPDARFALTREERRLHRVSKDEALWLETAQERLLSMRDFLLKKEEHDEHPSRRFAANTARAQRVFYRDGLAGPDHCSGSPGADRFDPRILRAGRPDSLAFASAGPDAVCDLGRRPGSEPGRADTRDPAGRRCLDTAGRKALARRLADQRYDPHRDAGIAGRKLCDLDGAGDRRGIYRESRRIVVLHRRARYAAQSRCRSKARRARYPILTWRQGDPTRPRA